MTSTATRPKDVMAELEQLETKWADATRKANEAAAEHGAKLARARELLGQRESEIARDPGLVDYAGVPTKPDNVVAKINKKIAELDASGSVDEVWAKYEHAQKIEEHAKQAAQRHIVEHFDGVLQALQPEAEQAVEQFRARVEELRAVAGDYLALAHRVEGLRAARAVRDRDAQRLRVPALEAGNAVVRRLNEWQVDLPLPTTVR